METTTPVAPHVPPSPPKEKPKRIGLYFGMFSTAMVKTLGVGLGLALLFLGAGVITEASKKSQCNVSVRTLHGELMTYATLESGADSGTIVRGLERDQEDENIKAIVLDVDSPGGLPVAGEEIADALARLTKPNVAVIRSLGASAAYWAAAGSDRIFASKSSDVGSIGVIVSFPDESEKNKKDGIAYNEFASGKFKNLGTPTRPVTPDEKALLERDIKQVYENFIAAIAYYRNLDNDAVAALADGSSMTGGSAKDAGLIDEIGGFDAAKTYLKEQIGEDPVFCEPDAEPLF